MWEFGGRRLCCYVQWVPTDWEVIDCKGAKGYLSSRNSLSCTWSLDRLLIWCGALVALEGVMQGKCISWEGKCSRGWCTWAGGPVIKQRARSLKEMYRRVWRRVCKEAGRPERTVWEITLIIKREGSTDIGHLPVAPLFSFKSMNPMPDTPHFTHCLLAICDKSLRM